MRSDQRSQEVANHIHLSELAPGPQDVKARAKIASRLDRFTHGNPGDVKSVGDGVSEMRIDYGPGYRVYFTQRGREVVWLLGSE